MNVLTILIYVVWFVSEILINRLTRSNGDSDKDKSSLALIWIAVSIGMTASIFIKMYCYYPIAATFSILYVGLGIIVFGIIVRLLVVKSLGKLFTANVTIRENHTLRTDGFYKFLRHPSYFASLLSFVGFGISLNNWVSLIVIFTIAFLAFLYRIKVEEIALTAYFGQDYENYRKSTKAIIPFIY